MNGWTRTALLHYGGAVLLTAAAVALRWLLDPWLGDHLPLATLYGAVALAVWVGGYGPAAVAALVGYLACDLLFIDPRGAFGFDSTRNAIGLLAYLLSCAAIIGFGGAMRVSRRRAEAGRERLEQEVAHRRQAESRAQDAHRQAVDILEAITDAYYTLDREWRYTYLNAHAERYFGRPKREMLGLVVWDLFPETKGSAFEGQYRKAVDQGVPVHFEVVSPVTGRWAEVHAYPSAEGLSVFFRDITARKQEEEALRESEERFRSIFDQTIAGFAQTDLTGRFVRANGRYCEIVGRTAGELLRLRMQDITHPDDLPGNLDLFGRMVEENGEPFVIEKRYVRSDGSAVWVSNSVSLVRDRDGRPKYTVAASLDITDRKRAEAALRESELRYRLVGEAANDAIWDWDLATNRATWHEGVRRLFGYSPEEIGPDATWWYENIHPEDRERVVHGIHAAIDGGEDVWRDEYRFRRADGSFAEVFDRGRVVRDGAGRPVRMVGSMLDLTERKQVERALRAAEERFRGLMEQAPFSIQMFAPDGRTLRVNRAWEQLWGVTLDRIGGYNILQDPQLEAKGVLPLIRRAFAGETVHVPAFEYDPNRTIPDLPLDGDARRWAAGVVYPLKDGAGRVREVVVVHEDITARMRAEETLRDREATLRAFYDHSPLCMGVTEPTGDGDVLHVYDNPACCRFFGAEPGATTGKRALADLGADPAVVARWLDCYRESGATGRPVHFEHEHPTPHGPRWLSATVCPIGPGPSGRTRFCYVAEDVTDRRERQEELRQSEERLRLALEAGRMGVWDWDIKTNRIGWSDTLEPVHGLAPGTFGGTLEAFQRLVHPEDQGLVQRAVERALEERSSYEAEFRTVWPDGSVHWMAGKGKVFTDGGQPARMVGIGMDITDRKRAEDRLREETRLAEALNRVGRSLAAELDLQRIVQTVTDEGTGLTGAQFGAFFYKVVGDRGETYTLYTISGVPREAFDRFPTPRNTAIFEPTFAGRGVVRLDDVTQDPRYGKNAPYHGMPEGHLPVRSYLAVPVVARSGEVLGGLFFGHPEAGVFTDRHERLVGGIAAQAAVAVDNARLYGQVQESEQRFRQLAEHVDDVFYVSDARRPRVLYISPAYERVWGRTRQSLYDQPRSFLEAVHPEDRGRVAATLEAQVRGQPTTEEYRITRPDGAVRWVWDRAFPIRDAGGQVYRVAGIAEDVTERRRAGEDARFLADASASLATVVDEHSTLQKVATLAVPRFGDWCAVDMVGPDGSLRRLAVAHSDPAKVQLAHELDRRYPPAPDAPAGAPHVARTGESEMATDIPDSLLEAVARDGEHLRILRELGLKSYLCVPMKVRGKVLGVLTFVAAESGRRYGPADLALAEELAGRAAVAAENARLYAELREADRRKDEFLAMLAHELRNPLAPIRNSLQILKMPVADRATIDRSREMMERQVQHLVRLVDDLLDVSRVMRGKVELRKERVDLAAAVARAVETAQPAIDAQSHDLTLALDPEPLVVDADPVRLTQVVANLLNNAAKYTERGGRITVSTERQGGHAVVRVRDTGIGIAPDMLPKVFGLFVQVENSVSRSQGGLGIGLTLVKSLVEMHGGAVEAHSPGLGKGSEFVVRLPLVGTTAPVGTHEADGSGPVAAPEGPRRRVLVVDDNVDAADSLAELLRLSGNDVLVAHGGPSALQIAASFRPDIAILDIGMPGMDGYELAVRLRQGPAPDGVLLVALTGWGQESDRRRSEEAGFDLHLVKPVDPDALQRLLNHPKLPVTVGRVLGAER